MHAAGRAGASLLADRAQRLAAFETIITSPDEESALRALVRAWDRFIEANTTIFLPAYRQGNTGVDYVHRFDEFIAQMVQYLRPGGYFLAATDWEPYAQQMLEVLGAEPALRNTANGFAPRPAHRPMTKFESRGLGLGLDVFDLVFERRDIRQHA